MTELIATKLVLATLMVLFLALFVKYTYSWVRGHKLLSGEFWYSIFTGTVAILIAWFV